MGKRELIDPTPRDKRYVRRDEKGQLEEIEDVSRSRSADVRKSAKTNAWSDHGGRKT